MKSFLLLQAVLLWTITSANLNDEVCHDHLFEEMDFPSNVIPSNAILILRKESEKDCSEACTKYEDCEFFTYHSKTHLCYLRSCTMLASPPEVKIVHGVVSGYSLKDCDVDDMCGTDCSDLILDGYDFPGLEFSRTVQPDPDRCQLVCSDLPRCKFFTFVNDTHPDQDSRFSCSLKSSDLEVPAVIIQRDHYHSGYSLRSVRSHKSCSSEAYEDLDFPGNDQRNVKVKTYEHCREACTEDQLCQMWTFVDIDYPAEELRYKCTLKSMMELPAPDIREHDDAVSGFSQKKCTGESTEA